MRITGWDVSDGGPVREVSAEADGFRLWYRVPASFPIERSGDPWLAAALLPAMSLGEAIEVDPDLPVSARLLENLKSIQAIHHAWNPRLETVPIRASARPAKAVNPGVLAFFSGGVDSTFTLLKHREEISHLVFIQGFDFFAGRSAADGFATSDISDLSQFAHKLAYRVTPVSSFLRDRLSQRTVRALSVYLETREGPDELEASLAADLHRLITGPGFDDRRLFASADLRPETRHLLEQGAPDPDKPRRNRLLLEDAFPLEIAREKDRVYDLAVARNSRFAGSLGKTLIPVETNHFPFGYRYNLSRNLSQGGALAGVALLLGFRRAFFPSSYAYDQLFPLGSHPLLDPLWSTEGLEVVHDGAEATRVDKVRAIAGEPLALQNLRVCFRDMNTNCGRCLKCLRTMISLKLLGAAAVPFPPLPSTKDISQMRIHGAIEQAFFQDNLALALESRDRELQKALRTCLRRHDRQVLFKSLARTVLGGRLMKLRRKRRGSVPDFLRIDTTPAHP